jgi:hypothetical protein
MQNELNELIIDREMMQLSQVTVFYIDKLLDIFDLESIYFSILL